MNNDFNLETIKKVHKEKLKEFDIGKSIECSIEECFKLIIESTNDFISITDLEFNLKYVSPSHINIGYSQGDLIGKSGLDFVHPKDLPNLLPILEEALKQEPEEKDHIRINFRFKDKFGHWKHIESTVNLIRDDNRDPNSLLFISRDVSDRIESEIVLKESEQKYRLITENSVEVIWTMDEHLNFTFISPSVTQLRGYSPDEAMEMSLEESFTEESYAYAMSELSKELLKPDEDRPFSRYIEVEQKCKDGSTIWTEVLVKGAFDDNDNLIGLQGSTRNISKRKEGEKEQEEYIKQIESLNKELIKVDKTRNELLANTSHELRTPLNAMIGLLKLLDDGLYNDHNELKEFIAISLHNARYLLNIINELLDYAHLESGNLELHFTEIDLSTLLKEMEELFQEEARKKQLQ